MSIKRYKEKIDAMEKALEFYADFSNYCGYGASSSVDIDWGKKARAALKKARGQSNG